MMFEFEEDEEGSLARKRRRRQSAAAEGLADDELSEDDDDDERDLSATLVAPNEHLNLEGRGYSTSPSQIDGVDLMEDLREMSDYADRIEVILDRQASSFGHSSLESRPRSAERDRLAASQAEDDFYDDDEID